MKKVSHNFFIYCMTVIISGCSTYYPIPVDEENIKQRLEKSDFEWGLPIADTQHQALENMKEYADWYLLKSNKLKKSSFIFSDASLGMTIVGLAAGFAGKAKGAAESVFLSNMLDIPSSRYQIKVQSSNYEKASDVMLCMYQPLKPIVFKEASKKSDFYERPDVPNVSFLNERINDVRKKLRDLQTSVTLSRPDIEKIESAIKEELSRGEMI